MTPLTLEFLGHSSFRLEHACCGQIYLDPWLTGNPASSMPLEAVEEARYVCVTHGHRDHLGDAIPISHRTGALLISTPEICAFASRQGIAYEKQSYGLNVGGTFRKDGFAVTMTHAFHTSEIQGRQYHVDRSLEPGSGATGLVFDFNGEHRIYYTGDTGVFGDMKLFMDLYQPDAVILPIGGKFTMGPREAAKALELMRPPVAIPCHFDTFANQKVDLDDFRRRVAAASPDTQLVVLRPGETWVRG